MCIRDRDKVSAVAQENDCLKKNQVKNGTRTTRWNSTPLKSLNCDTYLRNFLKGVL